MHYILTKLIYTVIEYRYSEFVTHQNDDFRRPAKKKTKKTKKLLLIRVIERAFVERNDSLNFY